MTPFVPVVAVVGLRPREEEITGAPTLLMVKSTWLEEVPIGFMTPTKAAPAVIRRFAGTSAVS